MQELPMRQKTEPNDAKTLLLRYQPPYPWTQMLEFLARRAIPGVEQVKDGAYWRTINMVTSSDCKPKYGWMCVRHYPQENALAVTAAPCLRPVSPQVLARTSYLFDLDCNPEAVFAVLSAMNDLRPGLCVLGTRLPGCFDPFEMVVRAVLGQQITVKAANTLAARLVAAYGVPLQTGITGLTHVFPLPETILTLAGPIEKHLGQLGITSIRAKAIQALAQAFVQGEINFEPCPRFQGEVEGEIEKLLAIPGIGPWTAHYIAMRAIGWSDAFMNTDYGVKKALEPHKPKAIRILAEAWRPWRSYAMVNLWNSL